MENLKKQIIADLKNGVNESYKKNFKRFFKPNENIRFFGTPSTATKKVISKYLPQIKILDKKERQAFCEELLKMNFCETTSAALAFVYRIKKYEKEDFKIFKNWLKNYVSNWAACDDLCTHALGEFLFQFPEFLSSSKILAESKNRWFRRAAAVSLIFSLRRKTALQESFKIADILLQDKDDLVQKGYGWMLKEASKTRQKEVFEFVLARKNKMPRTALRYAIEKLPKNAKKHFVIRGC